MSVSVDHADCVEWLAQYAARIEDGEVDPFDSCVTDPPYHLTSIVKRFGKNGSAAVKVPEGGTGAYARASRGFMGQEWDGGDVAFRAETWRAVFDCLKPGAHLVAFSGTRTYHRMACAIEDAGFEIRDQLAWVYGTGFPKSHDVAKGIDKTAGAVREVVGVNPNHRAESGVAYEGVYAGGNTGSAVITAPATPEAQQWEGWGTALKPSQEPVCLAQKPYTFEQEWVTIRHLIERLWSALWLTLPANDAAQFSTLSPSACGVDPSAFAQWIAEQRCNTLAALSGLTDTSPSGSALITSLNTVSSWNDTLAASCLAASTSITGTESRATTDLRTLRFCLSQITPANIIQAHKSGRWSNADACNAARLFNASVAMLSATLELSAVESATDWEAIDCPDAGAPKPSWEPICLARKPLSEKSVAANVLRRGTGAINIDGCRIEGEPIEIGMSLAHRGGKYGAGEGGRGTTESYTNTKGRWPANVAHDGSDEVLAAFPDSNGQQGVVTGNEPSSPFANIYGDMPNRAGSAVPRGDSGSAARFFYSAKAGPLDRLGSKHPTVKPVDLMRWLVRLVTPPGGKILEPFAGSGTTGIAAIAEGFGCQMIELEAEHVADIERKLAYLRGEGSRQIEDHLRHRAAKEVDVLPLFGSAP